MTDGDILVVSGEQVRMLLAGRERDIVEAVAAAYQLHAQSESSLPHSTFLRLPNDERNRIIALPAYLGGGFKTAGIKWISSFPGNLEKGLERASAVVILNCMETGRPQAFIEGSVISAKRTAGSAALAAIKLHPHNGADRIGFIGCGLIGFEIARFMTALQPLVRNLIIFDRDPSRAEQFKRRCGETFGGCEVEIADRLETVVSSSPIIFFATTALSPHVFDLSPFRAGTTILHISLRDLAPEVILKCDNVVDDLDHVCRAETSIHLAERLVGNKDFVRCGLAEILNGSAPARQSPDDITVFSPFGLGILDLAVARLVYDVAVEQNVGTALKSFLPVSWANQQ